MNNFALHVNLETPVGGGAHNSYGHSGCSSSQYDALALVLDAWRERFGFPATAITGHAVVGLGGERSNSRSFE